LVGGAWQVRGDKPVNIVRRHELPPTSTPHKRGEKLRVNGDIVIDHDSGEKLPRGYVDGSSGKHGVIFTDRQIVAFA
jgi:hypothetical protein